MFLVYYKFFSRSFAVGSRRKKKFEISTMSLIINSFELVALSFSWIIGGFYLDDVWGEKEKKKIKRENIKIFSAFLCGTCKKQSPQTIEDFPLISFPEIFFLTDAHWKKRSEKKEVEKWKSQCTSFMKIFSFLLFFFFTSQKPQIKNKLNFGSFLFCY